MGLLDTVQGLLGKKSSNAPAAVGHQSFVTVRDGDAAFNSGPNCVGFLPAAGMWGRIWEMSVPAQTAYAWGFGVAGLPDNQGYWWFLACHKTGVAQLGIVRLGYEKYARHQNWHVTEVNDSILHAVAATYATADAGAIVDKKSMQALPEASQLPVVGQDSRLTIDYKTLVAATGAADDVDFVIPVTIYN